MKKIDIGCGKQLREGYEGIDKIDYGQKHILDLETDKLPYDDDSVDAIYANHFLEHLKDTKHCLNECWRVLKKDGVFEANCPYCFWDGAQNPTHFQCVTEFWFVSLRGDSIVGFKPWEIKSIKTKSNPVGQKYEVQAVLTKNENSN